VSIAAADSAPALRSPRAVPRWSAALQRARAIVHAMMGVPDYERYLRHLSEHHPGCPVPTRAEFERERLKARYERPGSRCC
jgi:uncharacterized short protein YbdD (DUF466 family)